jgi:hypothetical protein
MSILIFIIIALYWAITGGLLALAIALTSYSPWCFATSPTGFAPGVLVNEV